MEDLSKSYLIIKQDADKHRDIFRLVNKNQAEPKFELTTYLLIGGDFRLFQDFSQYIENG